MPTSRIEDTAADPRVLRAEELDAVNGGDSNNIRRFNVTLYCESMKFVLQEQDA